MNGGLGDALAATVVVGLGGMVADFPAEEEWPELDVNVALLLYDVCCCLGVPERLGPQEGIVEANRLVGNDGTVETWGQ